MQYLRYLQLVLQFPELAPVRVLNLVDLVTLPLGVLLESPRPTSAPAEDAVAASRLAPDAQYGQSGRAPRGRGAVPA